jgi:2-dehydro-3-deoxygluconokinase
MTTVVTFGETMAALRSEHPLRLGGDLTLSIAGAESNVAIGLARLGHKVRWAGRVGADELGALIVRTLRAEGVATSQVSTDPERGTGMLLFERRVGHVTRVIYRRAGSAGGALTAGDILPALDSSVSWVHATGITAALGTNGLACVQEVLGRARELGAGISLDLNYRAQLWSRDRARGALFPLARMADILFGSADELPLVADDPSAGLPAAAEGLLAAGTSEVVVKRGAQGADAYTADGVATATARDVPVVDVVGAGDAFVAGYLSAMLDGQDTSGRLQRAVTVGAFAVAHRGDWEGLPDRNELPLLDGGTQETHR